MKVYFTLPQFYAITMRFDIIYHPHKNFQENKMANIQNLIQDIKSDKIKPEDQLRLVEAMHPTVRREIVQKIAGLDTSLVLTFKTHVGMVEDILKSIMDGSKDEFDISLKDTLALSTRLTQIMIRDLPKIYNLAKIQKQEQALLSVMEKHFTRSQQEEFLKELERIEMTQFGE